MSDKKTGATTWREDEIRMLEQLFKTLLRGGDVRQIVRSKAFASAAKKVQGLHARLSVNVREVN